DLEYDLNSPRNVLDEKQLCYCVSVPGESDWVHTKDSLQGTVITKKKLHFWYYVNVWLTYPWVTLIDVTQGASEIRVDEDDGEGETQDTTKVLRHKYPDPNRHHTAAILKVCIIFF